MHSLRKFYWQSGVLFILLGSLVLFLWLGAPSQATAPPASIPAIATPPATVTKPLPQVESAPQAATDGGMWTLDYMYITIHEDDDWERKDVANSSGGTIAHNASWTDYQGHTYDAKTTLTFSMPQSIPADGEAVISASGTAEWTSAGMTGRRKVYLWVGGTGPTDDCDPSSFQSQDNVQGSTAQLAAGPNNCTIKPALNPAGSNQFWVSFSLQTDMNNPSLVVQTVHDVEIWVSASFRYCASAIDCRSIEGKVFAVPPDNQRYPLIGVPVTLLRNGQFLRQTITEPPDGHYVLNHVPITNSLTLSVTLRNDANFPSPFQVQIGAPGQDPLVAATAPFSTSALTPVEEMDIGLSPGFHDPPLTLDPAIPPEILDDTGIIYYHTWEAWALTDEVLGQKLDLKPPLEVVAFSVDPPNDGVYYLGPYTSGDNANVQPYINIDVDNSVFSAGHRPKNREYHEFGHYVMADTFGNLMPTYDIPGGPADVNHAGFSNPSTTDSWMEGFAEFYAMLVAKHIGGDPRPELYRINARWEENLESNSVSWRYVYNARQNTIHWLEELAVAGLLWDLVDPVDGGDSTPLGGTDYADCVDIHESTFWNLFANNWHDAPASVTLSAAAPPGYGYIFDIKQLYEVLRLMGIGATHSRGRAITDLDELFIAHGFFADVDSSGSYATGELIGATGNARWTLPTGNVLPARDVRRSPPSLADSYIAFQAQDATSHAAMELDAFLIDVQFASPYEHYSYSFQTNADSPGMLYFQAPDTHYDVTTHIAPLTPGYTGEPLLVNNADYFDQLATSDQPYFTEHTFILEPAPTLFMPLVRGSGALQTFADQSATGADAPRTAPCLPPDVTPTPTPTATPTGTPVPIVESVAPNAVPQGQDVQVMIYGHNFAPFAGASIGNRVLESVQYLGFEPNPPYRERVQGMLTAGLPQGAHDVAVVRVGGAAGQLTAGFTILPPATATPTPTATPTLTPTPTPTPTQELPPIFADDFSDPGSGWPVADSATTRYAYVDGEYQIWLKAAEYIAWTTPGVNLSDLRLEVDARQAGAGAGSYGLMFGLSDDAGSYTLLFVDNEGYFMLTRYEQGQWTDLIPWAYSEAISTGGASNHIVLQHQGMDLEIWVNGESVASLSDYAPIPGRTGLTAWSYDEPFDARFDNFQAFDLSPAAHARPVPQRESVLKEISASAARMDWSR